MEEIQSIGMREFRANLAHYANMQAPIEITSHGHPVGYYIPARQTFQESKVQALQQASAQIASLLKEQGITEEELLAEFKALREGKT